MRINYGMHITVNLPNGSEREYPFRSLMEAGSVDALLKDILIDYPNFTSAVIILVPERPIKYDLDITQD